MAPVKGTMIDTETLSLGPKAMIWEIACVPFEIHETGGISYLAGVNAIVDYSTASTRGFDVDLKTIDWTNKTRKSDPSWYAFRRSQLLQESLDDRPRSLITPLEIYRQIDRLMTDGKPVWFRNAAFDVPVLENFFQLTCGMSAPWGRRRQSDLYTMINMVKTFCPYEDPRPAEAVHGAYADAMDQIAQLKDLMRLLREGMGNGKV